MALKKIDKEFCLTDNSVNVYGYRLLTEGLALNRFKPAIGFLMHKRDNGVAVRWEDFRQDGDKLYAKPVVNISTYPNLANQIEDGFYDSASVGHIVALELSDDPELKIDGQTGPTVTKWFPRECSIVDIPGNYNAIGQLYDENGSVLHDLSANQNSQKHVNMSQIIVTAAVLGQLNLQANASDDQFATALSDLVAKAAKSDALEKELSDLKAAQSKEKVQDILKKGVTDRKITKELSATLEKDYAQNPEGLQALVNAMPAQSLVADGKGGNIPTDLPEKFKGKSFDDLYVSGELEELKANFPDYYVTLKTRA